ncbi:MAG: HesA/MoeB/ThiF family protein [Eubacteriales bacterium]|nr:HesA/MoeB/ThiF family protein [Eubacteriales bacterium]
MKFSRDQLDRYARQFLLSELGVKGQQKLLESRVLVIGAGALGSAALLYLAAAGVGTIGIADGDDVQLSNLHRQVIHRISSIGISKLESAKQAILERNPDVKVILHPMFLTVDNILQTIADYDFILDCTDRFEAKFLINDACVLAKKPYSHAGIVRFAGQIMTYVPGQGPCLRCLLGGVPKNSATCAEVGVLGSVVGILGSMQATEAIKYLTGIGELLTGRVVHVDGLCMRFRTLNMAEHAADCAVCGDHPTITSLDENRDAYVISCSIPQGGTK